MYAGFEQQYRREKNIARFFLISTTPTRLFTPPKLTIFSRRDGSPFMNLLMVAPLCDSRGNIRYFIGAQIDVSGLVKDCTDLESLERLVEHQGDADANRTDDAYPTKDEFRELSEMLSMSELETVRKWGGRMHQEQQENNPDISHTGLHRPRLLLKEQSIDLDRSMRLNSREGGHLSGVYQNVSFRALQDTRKS